MNVARRSVGLLCVLAGSASAFAVPAIDPVDGSVDILVTAPKLDRQTLAAEAAAAGGQLTWSSTLVAGLHVLKGPADAMIELAGRLRVTDGVTYAAPAERHETLDQSVPYGINLVSAPAFWAVSSAPRGAGATVAVLDTGIANAHPDLPVPVATASFIAGETVFDGNSHGTHCAGTILALDNTDGVIGVAPQANLMVAKVLANSGSGSTAGIVQAIEWVVTQGGDVVSMSLGGGGYEQPFQDIINAANDAGIVVVAAAGNSASSAAAYPAWYGGVISVGAVDSSSALASFSNFGPKTSVVAPGVSVLSTVPAPASVDVTWSGTLRSARALAGAASGEVTASAVFCGFGGTAADFPPEVAGNIAHIRRGGVDGAGNRYTFQAKVNNAIAAGAAAVVISNDAAGAFTGTLNQGVGIPAVSITDVDGNALQAVSGVQTTIRNVLGAAGGGYGNKSGTSMACPHVAGVAGLLIAEFRSRNITPALVRQALELTAVDLGDAGRDDTFGWGLVNVAAARTWLDSTLPPVCAADLTGSDTGGPDGTVDGSDFIAFINAFAAGEPAADVVLDGTIDGSDFIEFINSFGAGC
jgi:serine protease